MAVAGALGITVTTVVDATSVSVETKVLRAGQSVTVCGQAVIVTIRVVRTVDVLMEGLRESPKLEPPLSLPRPLLLPLPSPWGTDVVGAASVTGQMVVET